MRNAHRGNGTDGNAAPQRVYDARRVRAVLLSAFCLYFAWIFLARAEASPFLDVFVDAAKKMCQGRKIHVLEENAYAYPPAMAFLITPLAGMPPTAVMGVWYLLNMAAAVVVLTACWRLAGGGDIARVSARWMATFALGLAIAFHFFLAPLRTQQFDMLIAALLLAGCWLLLYGAEIRGAVLIGAAAAMKCTPLLFVPYLVWRRKFAAAAAALVVALGLNLAPDAVFPQTSGRLYVHDWIATFVRPAANAAPGSWMVDRTQNQSLGGMLQRLSSVGLPLRAPASNGSAWQPAAAWWMRAVYWTCAGSLLLLTFWRLRFPLRPWQTLPRRRADIPVCRCAKSKSKSADPAEQAKVAARPPSGMPTADIAPLGQLRFSFECAAMLCLMLLLSPMSSKGHFVVTLLPAVLAARLFLERRQSHLRWLMVAVVLLGPLGSKGVLGASLGNLALWWSLPVWFVLVLLAWLCLAIREIDRETARKPIARPWFLRLADRRAEKSASDTRDRLAAASQSG